MPDYAVKFWGPAFRKISETTAFKNSLKKIDMTPVYMGPEQVRKIVPEYVKAIGADIKELDVYGSKKN